MSVTYLITALIATIAKLIMTGFSINTKPTTFT
jgi:hypothetical protein